MMKKILILNFLMLSLFNFAHPVTPQMMQLKNNPDYWFGLFFFAMSAGTFLFSPKWGSKIDQIGTKRILAMAPIFYAVGQLIFAYFSNPLIMLVGRFLSGVFASAWIVGVSAYINLKSKPSEKVKNFGYQLVAASLGGVVGQMLSGKIGEYNIYYSFAFQIFFLLVLSVVTYFVIDDLYPEAKEVVKTSILKALGELKRSGYLFVIFAMVCFATISNISKGMPSYFGSDVAGFTTSQVGYMNSYVNALALIANLFILRLIEKHFNFFKSYLLQGITSIVGASILLFAVLTIETNQYFAVFFILGITIVTLGSSLYLPNIQKKLVGTGQFKQGEILGVINSFNAVGMILSSLSMSFLYPVSPSLPFIALVAFAIFSIIFHLKASSDERAA